MLDEQARKDKRAFKQKWEDGRGKDVADNEGEDEDVDPKM